MSTPRHTITIVLQDQPDGSVSCKASPNVQQMIAKTKEGPMAESMAVAYALGALTYIATQSRKLKEKAKGRPLILLPPGTRMPKGKDS